MKWIYFEFEGRKLWLFLIMQFEKIITNGPFGAKWRLRGVDKRVAMMKKQCIPLNKV
jgi:hypothetical protein